MLVQDKQKFTIHSQPLKKNLLFLFSLYAFVAFSQEEIELKRCATADYQKIKASKFKEINKQLEQFRFSTGNTTIAGVVHIPVVVHVIHNRLDNVIGGDGNSNISDEQIKSQITVLNEDYRRKFGTRGYNTDSIGADVEFEFFLAYLDSNNNSSTGITRHYCPKSSFSPFDDDSLVKSFGYWPSDRYLNIWVCSLSGNYLGLTQFPNQSGLIGLDSYNGAANSDGIIINHKAFGNRIGTASKGLYSYGRTVTHEIGHWFGLIHTWGDADCGTDYCSDTPFEESSNLGSTCSSVYANCGSIPDKVMIENYLDYSPDICMNIFTLEQKKRMRTALVNSPRRANLLNTVFASSKDVLVKNESFLKVYFQNENQHINLVQDEVLSNTLEVEVIDLLGKTISKHVFVSDLQIVHFVSAANLTKGIYLLRSRLGNLEQVNKVMIY